MQAVQQQSPIGIRESQLVQRRVVLRQLERECSQAQNSRVFGWAAMGLGLILAWLASVDLMFLIGVGLFLLGLIGGFVAVVQMRARRTQIESIEREISVIQREVAHLRT